MTEPNTAVARARQTVILANIPLVALAVMDAIRDDATDPDGWLAGETSPGSGLDIHVDADGGLMEIEAFPWQAREGGALRTDIDHPVFHLQEIR